MQSVIINTSVVCSNHAHGKVYSIQRYVIKFVSDLRQVAGFLRLLQFSPPWYNWNNVKSGIKHQNPNPSPLDKLSWFQTSFLLLLVITNTCYQTDNTILWSGLSWPKVSNPQSFCFNELLTTLHLRDYLVYSFSIWLKSYLSLMSLSLTRDISVKGSKWEIWVKNQIDSF